MIQVGIVGASGYTGYELVQILGRHPEAEIVFATSESYAGSTMRDLYPAAPDLELVAAQDAPLAEAELVFLCLPHGAAAPTAVAALEAGARVVDLSADFRLRDPATYAQWYGLEHPAPHLLEEVVYGLTEFARDQLPSAHLVANPGCYPTSVLLPLQPLLSAGAVQEGGTIIADSKSGVSGAGRSPKQNTHFVEVANNLSPYNIGRVHRHLPEMEQELAGYSAASPSLIFTPYLLPVPRGILSTIYLTPAEGLSESDLRTLYQEAFDGEAFVELLPAGQLASLAHVTMSNRCVFSLSTAGEMVILVSAIDNLIKGAAGQAVQNMNVMYGVQETAGLA